MGDACVVYRIQSNYSKQVNCSSVLFSIDKSIRVSSEHFVAPTSNYPGRFYRSRLILLFLSHSSQEVKWEEKDRDCCIAVHQFFRLMHRDRVSPSNALRTSTLKVRYGCKYLTETNKQIERADTFLLSDGKERAPRWYIDGNIAGLTMW